MPLQLTSGKGSKGERGKGSGQCGGAGEAESKGERAGDEVLYREVWDRRMQDASKSNVST